MMTRFRQDGPPRWGAMLCALSVSLGVGLVGVSDRLDRFARGPEVSVGYRVIAPSGSPAIRRGDRVTLAAIVLPLRSGGELPALADLITRRDGIETHTPMTAAGAGAFTATLPGEATQSAFEYAVEAGFARSQWHRIRVADPVLLTACRIMVRPPHYAQSSPQIHTSWCDLTGVAGSSAELELTFDRPPAVVTLRLSGPTGDAAPVEVELGGVVARAAFPLPPSAILKLTATASAGLPTVNTLTIQTTPDTPPRLTRVSGFPAESFRARPGEVSELVFRSTDDTGPPHIELQQEGHPPQSVPLNNSIGKTAIPTTGSAGSVIRFRLVARDRSPARQVDTLPREGWYRVTLDAAALPLAEQAVRADTAESQRRLSLTQTKLTEAQRLLRQALGDTDAGPITPEANASLQSAALQLAGVCESARKLAYAAAEADTGRRKRVGEALHQLAAELTRLAAERSNLAQATELKLDAVALRELASELASGQLSEADTRSRLIGLVATRSGLIRAVAAADHQTAIEAARLAQAISAELAAFEHVAKAWPIRRRVIASAGPRARQWLLLRHAEQLAAETTQAARLTGTSPFDTAPTTRARQQLISGDLLDSAVAQETAAVAADRLADRLAATAAARIDRRETLHQLAGWRADLEHRQPRLGELAALRAAIDCIDPTLSSKTADLHRAANREPPRSDRIHAARQTLGTIRGRLARTPPPNLGDELARLDSRAWPVSPEQAIVALRHASETRHPGDVRFAADALTRLLQSLDGEESSDLKSLASALRNADPRELAQLATDWKSLAPSAAGLSPASTERITLALRRAERDRAADTLNILAMRQSGDESQAAVNDRLDAWATELPADARWQRLISQERDLTPPHGFARFVGPPAPRDQDRLSAIGNSFLADHTAADRLHEWAANQRQTRDATAAALAESSQPPTQPSNDPMADAAVRLDAAGHPFAARLARAGDRVGIESLMRDTDQIATWQWSLADEWARISHRGAELATDARRLAAITSGPAHELALDAANFLARATNDGNSLAEASFRLDATHAHLLPNGDADTITDDDRIAKAGGLIKKMLTGELAVAELQQAADQLTHRAKDLTGQKWQD